MTGFRTPPQGDFHSYSGLVTAQGGHLGDLGKWCGHECSETTGLDGLLALLRGVVPEFSGYFSEKTAQCVRGMHLVSSKVDQTSSGYTGTDQGIAAGLSKLYPAPLAGFPDLGAIPGASAVGNYTDEDVKPTEPTSGADDTAKNISHQMLTMREGFKSGPVAVAEKVFKYFTGQSLVALLLEPLAGDYGQLLYLHDAYDQLGDGLYTVTGTLRKGSWALGSEWTGQAATAFDSYMFSWTMGIGGLGDCAKVVAKIYKDGYDAVVLLVQAALREINKLMIEVLPKMAKEGEECLGGDAAIEAIGGGPEDPVADVVAGIFTAEKLYELYRTISTAISIINGIEKTFELIQKAVSTIENAIHALVKDFESPMPTIGSLINDVEQRGFSFEKSGWDPTLGAVRVGMLPAA
ncbi:WXG100 family type VII secretion target [Streptacidiphilus sp. EB129]|uniref:WXG100 family type VII secretion target n=1 Tax=Streptacidiphilus sp. EB129 TaxID=3156262 RepID=UPI00351395AC